MNPSCLIRLARLSDAAVIADFNLRLAWETEHQRLDPSTVRAGVTAVLGDPSKGVYYVAEVADQLVGQCCITYEWSDWRNGMFWWLQSVYVIAEFRAHGIFRALFESIHGEAQKNGVVGIRLYVEQNNLPAQSAYMKMAMNRSPYSVFERFLIPGPPG